MHEIFLQQACVLAEKGIGWTSPNPAVGSLIVKNGKVLGQGWHKKAGADHAEIIALKDARRHGYSPKGATLYTTLEPCCHTGKTPPCVDVLVTAKIKEVIVGMRDPNTEVNGRGISWLRKNGVSVYVFPPKARLAHEIRMLNQPFLKWMETGLPYVTLKAGTSLDGKIATRTGDSQWITSEKARRDARHERSKADAVLVGVGTVLADNPTLAAHGLFAKKDLLRVIIDPSLRSSPTQHVYRDTHVLVAISDVAPQKKVRAFQQKGIEVIACGSERIRMHSLLTHLAKKNIQHLYVEGGAGVHGSFFDEVRKDESIVDKILWYIAPAIIGGKEAVGVVGGSGVSRVSEMTKLRHVSHVDMGGDIKIQGYLNIY